MTRRSLLQLLAGAWPVAALTRADDAPVIRTPNGEILRIEYNGRVTCMCDEPSGGNSITIPHDWR